MTKEELEIAIKQQQSVINKNQRLAREFNKAVREAKKKQKELKSVFRKQELDRKQSEKQLKREEFEQTPQVKCAFIKSWQGNDGIERFRQCFYPVRGKLFCNMHEAGKRVCAFEDCPKNTHSGESSYCILHDPSYERVNVPRYYVGGGQGYKWRKKKVG